MRQARAALTAEDYSHALRSLLELRRRGTPEQKRFAQEFLGVCRENMGQLDFARAEYERFLARYPDASETARVEQRLAALTGLQDMARASETSAGQQRVRTSNGGWSNFGSLASAYRFSRNVDDSGDAYESLSLFSVDGDLSTRYRSDALEWQFRFSGGHYEDLRSDGDDTTERIRYLHSSVETAGGQYRLQLGRQRSYGAGVIGRFDGVVASGQTTDRTRLSFVAGYPVDTSADTSVDTERDLYGVNFDLEDLWDAADLSLFYVRQNIEDVVDREAVGGEAHYVTDRSSLYLLLDYDFHFGELNAFVLNGNHRLEGNMRLNWSANIRKSPYLSTRNALIGQGVDSIGDLQRLLQTGDELDDLADDRTRDSKSASVTLTRPLNDRLDLSGSVTWLDLSETRASGGVPAYDGTGAQFYTDFRITGRRLFGERDTSFLSTRYYNLASSDIWSVYANSRLPWGRSLSFNPRLRLDYRDNANGTTQWNFAPAMRAQYQAGRHLVYSEGGLIFYRTDYPQLGEQDYKIWFAYLGYRVAY